MSSQQNLSFLGGRHGVTASRRDGPYSGPVRRQFRVDMNGVDGKLLNRMMLVADLSSWAEKQLPALVKNANKDSTQSSLEAVTDSSAASETFYDAASTSDYSDAASSSVYSDAVSSPSHSDVCSSIGSFDGDGSSYNGDGVPSRNDGDVLSLCNSTFTISSNDGSVYETSQTDKTVMD